ncbi:MAG: hypothetical protein P8Z79_20240 [Sedimentisphaerales bacterium]|jgi:hypothetical protein
MGEPDPRRVFSKVVLAVEGKDEKNFFDVFLRYLGVDDFQIEEVGGKNQFPVKFPALLKMPGFFKPDESPFVTHVILIRDKDEDQAFESMAAIVDKEGLTPPESHGSFSQAVPKVGIFIMPGDTVEGCMLEDLCLKTVENHPAMRCVNEFISCASTLGTKPKSVPKAKAQAFLAAQPEIATSVGVGAQKSYWDFDSPALAELKEFLNHLK